MLGQRLRIAHVVEACGAGVGRHVLDLSAGQAARGHAVTVLYSPVRAERSFLEALSGIRGLDVRPVAMRREVGIADFASLRELAKGVRSAGPFDILHGHSSKGGALARMIPAPPARARIYTSHALRTMDPLLGAAHRLLYGAVERWLGTWFCDAVIVGSRQEWEAARAVGIPAAKLAIVANGIAPRRLASSADARTALGLPASAPVVGFVGRLAPQKAPERAVRALAAMRTKTAFLAMLGDGELEAAVRSLAARLGVADRLVIRSGMDGQLHMRAFDALLSTSRYESMGYVFLEALAAGVPIISTPVGIAPELVGQSRFGSIVPNDDDPVPAARALDDWVGDGRTKLHAARATDFCYPSADAMVDATVEVYRSVLGSAATRDGWTLSRKAP